MTLTLLLAGLGSPAHAANLLVYGDDDVSGRPIQIEQAALLAGHSVTLYLDDPVGFRLAWAQGGWDLVAIESVHNALTFDLEQMIRNATFDGVPLHVSHWWLQVEFAAQVDLGVETLTTFAGPPGTVTPLNGDPWGLFAGLPAGLAAHTNVILGDNGAAIAPKWWGEAVATTPQGDAIVLTRQGRVLTHGFMTLDYRNLDGNGDGVADNYELLQNEIDLLLSTASQPRLVIDGACPSAMPVHLEHLTPGGDVQVYRANRRGAGRVPNGPCAGTPLDLNPNAALQRLATVRATAQGTWDATPTVPTLMCLQFLQAVDLSTCQVTNVSGF